MMWFRTRSKSPAATCAGLRLRAQCGPSGLTGGPRRLVCSVYYTTGGERRFFRKHFRFTVQKPLDVKTKCATVLERVLLEAHVSNATEQPILLDDVALLPAEGFDVTSLNAPDVGTGRMRPGAVRRFVYALAPRSAAARLATDVAKMDIVWCTALGERGRLRTNSISRTLTQGTLQAAADTLRLEHVRMPARAAFGVPFELECTVVNSGGEDVDLAVRENPADVSARPG